VVEALEVPGERDRRRAREFCVGPGAVAGNDSRENDRCWRARETGAVKGHAGQVPARIHPHAPERKAAALMYAIRHTADHLRGACR
jgi:hypothetical protein